MKTAENLLTAAQDLAARVTSAEGSFTHTDYDLLRTQLANIDRRMADCEARGEALPPGWAWTRARIGELLQTFTTPNELMKNNDPDSSDLNPDEVNQPGLIYDFNLRLRQLISCIRETAKVQAEAAQLEDGAGIEAAEKQMRSLAGRVAHHNAELDRSISLLGKGAMPELTALGQSYQHLRDDIAAMIRGELPGQSDDPSDNADWWKKYPHESPDKEESEE